MQLRATARGLARVAPTLSPWPSAVRRGGVMAALLTIGVVAGQFEPAVAATTGALNIALLDGAVSRAVLSRALWLCLFVTTAIAFVAVIIGDDFWWLVPFLTLLAFLQGALSGAGLPVANATIAGMITAILFSVIPGSLGEAAVAAAWLFLGALVEILVALVAWRWERQSLLRRQMVRLLRATVEGRRDAVEEWRKATARTLAATELTPEERAGYRDLLDLTAEGAEAPGADLMTAAAVLRHGRPDEGGGSAAAAATRVVVANDRIEPLPPESARQQGAAVQALLRPGSASFVAGVRLALLMAVGATLVHVAGIAQGHWVLLVFALAIRPSYADTVVGLVARVIGVVLGVVVVAAVVAATGGSVTALLALGFVGGILACRWLWGNDIVFFTFLTVFVSVLVDAGDPLSGVGTQRIGATLVGVVVGLAGALLWPGWRRSDTARERLPEAA
ncbi:MAG: FUSC family protein [Candidatus Nanopelagicales bacterium]